MHVVGTVWVREVRAAGICLIEKRQRLTVERNTQLEMMG